MTDQTAPAGRFHNRSLEDLNQVKVGLLMALKTATAEISEIDAEYHRRFSSGLGEKLIAESKQSTTMEIEGGFKAKGSISKSIKWDGDILQTIAVAMNWEEIQHYFKIDFSMSEAIFKALPPGKLRDTVGAARTVKYGDLKVAVTAPAE